MVDGAHIIRQAFARPNYAVAPIAGLQLDGPGVAFADVFLVRCPRDAWGGFETDYIYKDWYAEFTAAAPVFLYEALNGPPDTDEAFAGVFERMEGKARRVISAIRLANAGPLLEPIRTVQFIVTQAGTFRKVGPRRTEYLAMPLDGLVTPLDDSNFDDVVQVYDHLLALEQDPGADALRAMLDQHNLARLPALSAFFATHVLFTLMEMLFDGLPRSLALTSSRYERAHRIVQDPATGALPAPVGDFFETGLRPLRNAVHHHTLRKDDLDLPAARNALQIPIAFGLRYLLALHRCWREPPVVALTAEFGCEELTPTDLLTVCLDRMTETDRSPRGRLASCLPL